MVDMEVIGYRPELVDKVVTPFDKVEDKTEGQDVLVEFIVPQRQAQIVLKEAKVQKMVTIMDTIEFFVLQTRTVMKPVTIPVEVAVVDKKTGKTSIQT